jgi:hypothetical protein
MMSFEVDPRTAEWLGPSSKSWRNSSAQGGGVEGEGKKRERADQA